MNNDEIFLQKQRTVKVWIEFVLNVNLGDTNILEALRDGRLLCKAMNSYHNRIDFIHYSNVEPVTDFKRNENMGLFLKKCRLYLPKEILFGSSDLEVNGKPELVLDCLIKLSEYFIQNRNLVIDQNNDENGSGDFTQYDSDGNIIIDNNNNNNNNGGSGSGSNIGNVAVNNDGLNTSSSSSNKFIDDNDRDNYQLQLQYQRQEQQNQQYNNNNNNANNNINTNNNKLTNSKNNINTTNTNCGKYIYKKGMNGYILDCILEVKHYILIPLFISVAAGFGIKMGRSIFVNMIDFKYALFWSNTCTYVTDKLSFKIVDKISTNISKLPILFNNSLDYLKSLSTSK